MTFIISNLVSFNSGYYSQLSGTQVIIGKVMRQQTSGHIVNSMYKEEKRGVTRVL